MPGRLEYISISVVLLHIHSKAGLPRRCFDDTIDLGPVLEWLYSIEHQSVHKVSIMPRLTSNGGGGCIGTWFLFDFLHITDSEAVSMIATTPRGTPTPRPILRV
jgi:hypothetical protein